MFRPLLVHRQVAHNCIKHFVWQTKWLCEHSADISTRRFYIFLGLAKRSQFIPLRNVVYFITLPFLVRKIFTFYINDVLLFKCPIPGAKGYRVQWQTKWLCEHSADISTRRFYLEVLIFKRRIKSRLPFAGIIRRSPYSPRFQDKS